jgi:hypothetical protein
MPEGKKKENTCQYKRKSFGYKCERELHDEKHCIFHSQDKEGKKDTFMDRFWQEYEAQKEKGKFIFTGFVFPPKADLERAVLVKAGLQEADLWGANLQGAKLQRAKLRGANLQRAKLQQAKLQRADIRRADLWMADLRGADLRDASFEKTKVGGVKYDRSTKFRGIDVTQAIGSPFFVRFAKDQEYLEEFQIEKPNIYKIWNIFADCGRTMWRWLFWCLVIALFFGAVFADYPVPNIKPQFLQDILISINPEFHIEPPCRMPTFFTPYYFSIVTFTTLGFGDITPLNLAGEIWLALEVFLGYIMLGGLISILANKLVRRS